jgi:DNA repair protein RecO
METQKDLAIVLKSIQFEERHRIITGLTQTYGLISAIARNSVQSRRFGGSLDLFTASDWTLGFKPHSELAQLTQAQVRHSFENLRKNFEHYALASTVTEFLLRLAPQNEPCLDLFQLHSNALFSLNHTQDLGTPLVFLNAYLAKLLQWSGQQPQLNGCLECSITLETLESGNRVSCLIANAAWICASCLKVYGNKQQGEEPSLPSHSVTARALRDFKLSLRTPIRQVLHSTEASSAEHQELYDWIYSLFIYHIPGFDQKPMKTLRFLSVRG